MKRSLASTWLVLSIMAIAAAADPCVSGLAPGARPGPYSFILSTGTSRGQAQCFICETADRPAVVVFARTPSESLGKLAAQLDRALTEHKAAELRAWVTFLSNDQTSLDRELVRWSQQHSLKSLPVGCFEDAGGPPSYKLARDADVTVILFARRKVQANFAFRSGELTDDAVKQIVQAVPPLLEKKP